jgi:predicted nucleic acid-binding protein
VLVDANVLLYAVDSGSRFHDGARDWLEGALNGERRVGIPSPAVRIARSSDDWYATWSCGGT